MNDIFGPNLFVFSFNLMGSNLRHSHVWLSWGAALAIWDHLFGCYLPVATVKGLANLSFGISVNNTEQRNLLEIYLMPFKLSLLALIQGRLIQKLGAKMQK